MQHKPSKTIEDYLQVMHYMTRDGAAIIGARLAERIHVAPPTVTATLQRMVRDGLITMDDHKVVHLTELGREAGREHRAAPRPRRAPADRHPRAWAGASRTRKRTSSSTSSRRRSSGS